MRVEVYPDIKNSLIVKGCNVVCDYCCAYVFDDALIRRNRQFADFRW
jgi:pyruvate-formate lyase-activating enzyme